MVKKIFPNKKCIKYGEFGRIARCEFYEKIIINGYVHYCMLIVGDKVYEQISIVYTKLHLTPTLTLIKTQISVFFHCASDKKAALKRRKPILSTNIV